MSRIRADAAHVARQAKLSPASLTEKARRDTNTDGQDGGAEVRPAVRVIDTDENQHRGQPLPGLFRLNGRSRELARRSHLGQEDAERVPLDDDTRQPPAGDTHHGGIRRRGGAALLPGGW